MTVGIIYLGVCVYWTLFGCIAATSTFPCHVTKDTSWSEGDHVNCSHRQLTQIPRDIPAGTTTLLLNNNNIGTLRATDFNNLTQLRHLDLRRNWLQSNTIAPDAFSAFEALLYLDLSYNNLCMSNECFPQSLYRPLSSLEVFKVTGNRRPDEKGIRDYPFQTLSVLQSLTELYISGMSNVDIPPSIALFKNLQVLDLHEGNIPNISVATFRALRHTNVTTLSLRATEIRHIEPGSFSNLPNLFNLNMACNDHIGYKNLIRVMWATENSGIDSLVMDHVERGGVANILKFNGVCHTSFAKRLRRLSVRQNNIIAVDTKYFGNCLPSLQWFNFGFNSILFYNRHGVKRLQVLTTFPPRLVAIDISHFFSLPDEFRKQYCSLDDRPFDGEFRRPATVVVSDKTADPANNVTLMPPADDEERIYILPSLRYVYADRVSLQSGVLDTPPLVFYPESNIILLNSSNSKAIRSITAPLKGFSKLQTLDMSHGILQHIGPDFFTYFEGLRFLNLSDNKLGDMTASHNQTQVKPEYGRAFNHLTSLEELDLSRNSFQTINGNAFANLTKLRILTLSDNMLKRRLSLNVSRLASLQSLYLSRNHMSSLSEDLRDSLDELSERVGFSLDISGNPLSCTSCASLPFLRWLRTTRVRIVTRDKLTCVENHKLRVVSASLDDLEASCASAAPGVSLLIVLSVAGGVGLCTITMLLSLYANRWRMRWYYYSLKRRLRDDDESTYDTGHYRYDACVVYADPDLTWVAHDLVDQVETDWALSLFLSDRDSSAGFPIAENIVQSLESSRYVLFVLTPDFCDDKWCNFALNMALLRDHKSLVLLYTKPIVHECASRTLRALMNPRTRCTLLEWGDGEYAQSLFWQRLHDTLLPTTDSDLLLYRLAPCTHRPLLSE